MVYSNLPVPARYAHYKALELKGGGIVQRGHLVEGGMPSEVMIFCLATFGNDYDYGGLQ